MKMKLYLIATLLLLPSLSFSQETNPAKELRTRKQYRNTLTIFKEPQIFPASNPSVEIYRVFIVPTFYHPLSVRVEKSGNNYFLVAKRLSGQGGYGWGTLKREKRQRLTEKEWQTFLDLLNQATFWALEPKDKEYEPNEKGELTICLDGTSWFLEGVSDGKYHAVDRYCPASKSFKAVGLYLIKLSNMGIKESDVL